MNILSQSFTPRNQADECDKSKSIPVIAVVGPTGVGKTRVSVFLSKAVGGEIVSCDSVQLYRYLDIGSAKPSQSEREIVPHHLINDFDPDFQIDVGIYKSYAEKAIIDICGRGKIPVVAGGTGLYFNSLYYGLFSAPSRSGDIRMKLEKQALLNGVDKLYDELKRIDPETAGNVAVNDKRRIIRALEVFEVTGKPISKLRADNKKLNIRWFLAGLNSERSSLYKRIEDRVDKMVNEGLLDETKNIVLKFGKDAFALGSIGYRHAIKHIEGEWDYSEFIDKLKQDSRHYAKRQITWFKKNKDIRWYQPEEKSKILQDINDFLANPGSDGS